MQISFAVVLGLLTTSISAIQIPRANNFLAVAVQLTNSFTGNSATLPIPLDGIARGISNLFGDTPVAEGGKVLASSATLVKLGGICTISDPSGIIAVLSDQSPFANLSDGTTGEPRDLSEAYIVCKE
ncbi:hypothetical protein ACJ72_01960 [Emergomyces africanus]|uniref:Uncharacterized protein n=1 Tax=Emergomyces africanus TaxID=1955775 RepID=A0A1B7P3R6_9EURO|nr:hypothetical protein ACJ72_01960 [Emergomyces africanus]